MVKQIAKHIFPSRMGKPTNYIMTVHILHSQILKCKGIALPYLTLTKSARGWVQVLHEYLMYETNFFIYKQHSKTGKEIVTEQARSLLIKGTK